MNSLKKTSRQVGLLWFLGSATAGFSLVYVRPKLIVPGDAAATVKNILAFESLFRAGIASMILSPILLLFFGLAIFQIFKGVNKTLATGCFASLLVGGGVGIVNSLNNVRPRNSSAVKSRRAIVGGTPVPDAPASLKRGRTFESRDQCPRVTPRGGSRRPGEARRAVM
jgi:hypothetical protein